MIKNNEIKKWIELLDSFQVCLLRYGYLGTNCGVYCTRL